ADALRSHRTPRPLRSICVHLRLSAVPIPFPAGSPNPASRRPFPLDIGCYARFCVLPPAGLGYSPAPAPDSHPAPESPMPAAAHFTPRLFKFLRELKRNNERAWFNANKARYITDVQEPMLRFIADFAAPLA